MIPGAAARAGGGDLSATPPAPGGGQAKAANMPADTHQIQHRQGHWQRRRRDLRRNPLRRLRHRWRRHHHRHLTDNRVRTVAEVRHAFSKHGGSMGTEGSVVFQFKHCGQLILPPARAKTR